MLRQAARRFDPRQDLARRRLLLFVRPVQEFVQTESASSVLLILAAAAALIWANSPWHHEYERLLGANLGIDLAFWAVEGTLHFWINEVAMVLFFFVIGLEIKREITIGELSNPRVMAAPVAGAIGGMLLPLALFLLIAQGPEARQGWAIPMATDVAFALGIATLFASRVPLGLRAMLLTFVIVDDIGTVFVIAVFYSSDIQVFPLLLTCALVASMLVLYPARRSQHDRVPDRGHRRLGRDPRLRCPSDHVGRGAGISHTLAAAGVARRVRSHRAPAAGSLQHWWTVAGEPARP